jgi:DNA polymerase-1
VGVPLDKIKYHHLTTIKQIDKLERYMMDSVSKFAIDTETTGQDSLHRTHVMFRTVFGVSIYFPYHAIWIEKLDEDNKFTKRVIKFLESILEDKEKIKILHNATFDLNGILKHKVEMQLPIWDTKTMAREYDENDLRGGLMKYRMNTKEKGLPLKPLVWKYLGWKYDALDFDKHDIKDYSLEERIEYGCDDVIGAYYLAEFYHPKLENQNLMYVFNTIEQRNIPAVAHMNRTGAVIDAPYLIEKADEVAKDVKRMISEIQELSGEEFNPRSSQQLGEVLYKKLKYPVKGYTKGGKEKKKNPSTGAPTLELLREDLIQKEKDTTLIDKLLFWKSVDQINKMYLKPFPKDHLMPDGRIYPQFPQNETVTARLKSRKPNFQNLKKEMKDPKHPLYHYAFIVKHSVIAPEGFWILAADYSQIEIRMLAHCSGEEFLINGFIKGGLDTHKLVASAMFDVPYDKVTEDQRQDAKELNFGIAYGMEAYGLSIKLKCTVSKAQEKIDMYFAKLPKVYRFIEKSKRELTRKGYVKSITGRRRRIPQVYDSNEYVRKAALREGVNFKIQSPATGDINKLALNALYEDLVDEKKIFMPLDIHDEIVMYVHDSIVDVTAERMQSIMENVYELKVPLVAEVEKKKRWVEEKIAA